MESKMKNQQAETLKIHTKTYSMFLIQRGLGPRLQRFDKKASIILKNYMYENKFDLQLLLSRTSYAEVKKH